MIHTTERIRALDAAAVAHEDADRLASAGQFAAAAAAFDRVADHYARAGFPALADGARGLAAIYGDAAITNPALRRRAA